MFNLVCEFDIKDENYICLIVLLYIGMWHENRFCVVKLEVTDCSCIMLKCFLFIVVRTKFNRFIFNITFFIVLQSNVTWFFFCKTCKSSIKLYNITSYVGFLGETKLHISSFILNGKVWKFALNIRCWWYFSCILSSICGLHIGVGLCSHHLLKLVCMRKQLNILW